MRLGSVRLLLLLAAFAAGQWLAWTHLYEHPAAQVDDVACVYCSAGGGLAHPPDAVRLPLDPAARTEVPPAAPATMAGSLAHRHQPIRGPPTLS